MAHSQEAADALTDEVKDLVKVLQDQNKNLEKEVESMSTYIIQLKQQMDDMHDRFYDVWVASTRWVSWHHRLH